MNTKAKKTIVAVLTGIVLLSIVLLSVSLFDGGGGREPDYGFLNATAAVVGEAVAPAQNGACPMAHAGEEDPPLYEMKSAENLKWLFEQATGSDLAACYALRTAADALDLSAWADTGVGSDTEAFTGHFNGGGRGLKFSLDGGKTPESGGCGLFPLSNGAVITDLNLEVLHARTQNGVSAPLGGTFTGCTVSNVNVTQQTTALGVPVIGETDLANSYRSAGLLAYSNGSLIENCSVVDLAGVNTAFNRYGGIVLENRGTVTNCSYVLQAAAEGGAIEVNRTGGIACINAGTIERCRVSMPNGIASGRYFGGIAASTGYGQGVITECFSDFRVTVKNDALQASYIGGIAGELITGGAITDCRVSGGAVLAWQKAGGIAGSVQASYGNTSRISGCDVSLTSIGTEAEQCYAHIGGIVGIADIFGSVEIESCSSSASIYSGRFSGGLLGQANYLETADVALTPANPLTFTMKDCHMLGDKVVSRAIKNADGTLYSSSTRIGGAIGSVYGWREGDGVYSTLITNCTSGGNVQAGDWAGGFIGEHSAKETVNKPKDRENTIEYCRAFGDVETLTGRDGGLNDQMIVGGFIGLGHSSSMNLVVNNCSASGNVASGNNMAGGFLGGDGWRKLNTASNNKYLNCTATGNVNSKEWAGGWASHLASYGLQVQNCSFTGDVKANFAGGFVANVTMNVAIRDCTATGNVRAEKFAGGFASFAANSEVGETILFENCAAAGTVTRLDSIAGTANLRGTGGFIARVNIAGTVQFRYCTAAGAVTGDCVGGFMGYSMGAGVASFYLCEAYGNVKSDTNGEAGGFIGWSRSASLSVDGCKSYGSAVNGNVHDADAAGFISALESKGTIKNCASYAPAIEGYAGKLANFLILYKAGSAGTVISDCTYTVCTAADGTNLPMIIYWNAETDNLVSNTNPLPVPQANRPQVPGSTFACAVTASGNTLSVSATGVAAATSGTLTELSVSLDGGRNFSQLVYNGIALTALGSVAAGSSVANGDIAFTYTALKGFTLADVRVLFTYSDGFTRLCRAG